jgi:hypothetical protein
MPNHRHVTTLALLGLLAAACSSSAGPPAPSNSTASATPAGIEHPSGAKDVVLEMEVGGGFVPMEFLATQAPTFTLYGDGVVVFQPQLTQFPEPGPDGVTRLAPWRTAQLDAGQMDELLTFALGPGGLGAARESYAANGIADAPDTIFTVDAGGVKKTVSINALGLEQPGGQDEAARKAFQKLAERLSNFDNGGTISTDAYVPASYRAVIFEREPDPVLKPVPWPWPTVKPSDFTQPPADGSGLPFPHRTITADEVAALKLGEAPGGMQGLVLQGPDDKLYSFIIRPLLPAETE